MSRKAITDYKVILEYDVRWGDIDAANHVNNLVYLKWTESARIHYFQLIGINISFTDDEAGPILGWQDCKYIYPMTYPDTALVGIKCQEILENKIMFDCSVFSKTHDKIAAISLQTLIPYNYKTLKRVPIPQAWIDNIQNVEKNA